MNQSSHIPSHENEGLAILRSTGKRYFMELISRLHELRNEGTSMSEGARAELEQKIDAKLGSTDIPWKIKDYIFTYTDAIFEEIEKLGHESPNEKNESQATASKSVQEVQDAIRVKIYELTMNALSDTVKLQYKISPLDSAPSELEQARQDALSGFLSIYSDADEGEIATIRTELAGCETLEAISGYIGGEKARYLQKRAQAENRSQPESQTPENTDTVSASSRVQGSYHKLYPTRESIRASSYGQQIGAIVGKIGATIKKNKSGAINSVLGAFAILAIGGNSAKEPSPGVEVDPIITLPYTLPTEKLEKMLAQPILQGENLIPLKSPSMIEDNRALLSFAGGLDRAIRGVHMQLVQAKENNISNLYGMRDTHISIAIDDSTKISGHYDNKGDFLLDNTYEAHGTIIHLDLTDAHKQMIQVMDANPNIKNIIEKSMTAGRVILDIRFDNTQADSIEKAQILRESIFTSYTTLADTYRGDTKKIAFLKSVVSSKVNHADIDLFLQTWKEYLDSRTPQTYNTWMELYQKFDGSGSFSHAMNILAPEDNIGFLHQIDAYKKWVSSLGKKEIPGEVFTYVFTHLSTKKYEKRIRMIENYQLQEEGESIDELQGIEKILWDMVGRYKSIERKRYFEQAHAELGKYVPGWELSPIALSDEVQKPKENIEILRDKFNVIKGWCSRSVADFLTKIGVTTEIRGHANVLVGEILRELKHKYGFKKLTPKSQIFHNDLELISIQINGSRSHGLIGDLTTLDSDMLDDISRRGNQSEDTSVITLDLYYANTADFGGTDQDAHRNVFIFQKNNDTWNFTMLDGQWIKDDTIYPMDKFADIAEGVFQKMAKKRQLIFARIDHPEIFDVGTDIKSTHYDPMDPKQTKENPDGIGSAGFLIPGIYDKTGAVPVAITRALKNTYQLKGGDRFTVKNKNGEQLALIVADTFAEKHQSKQKIDLALGADIPVADRETIREKFSNTKLRFIQKVGNILEGKRTNEGKYRNRKRNQKI